MGLGLPEAFVGIGATVSCRASIGFAQAGSSRTVRASTPWLEYDPSAQDVPGQFLVVYAPPFSVDYDVLVHTLAPPAVPSAVLEVDITGGYNVPRAILDVGGAQSLLNATRIASAAWKSLGIQADPALTVLRFRISWGVRV
jgi:hypothetical protein